MDKEPMKRKAHEIGPKYLLGLYREFTRSPETPSNMRLCAFLNALISDTLLINIVCEEPVVPTHVDVLLRMAADELVVGDPTWISAEALAADNKKLRRLLALRVAGSKLYTDDGELSDASEHPSIDFKRMPVSTIEAALYQRGVNRTKAALGGEGVPDASVAG